MSRYTSSSADSYWATDRIFDRYGTQAISGPPNASMRYEPRRVFDPYVALGPVIGMVTDTTARILVETSHDTPLKCFLTDKYGVQHGMSKTAYANTPLVFNFYELKAKTYYRVTFDLPVPGLVKSGFRTLPVNWSLASNPGRIAVVSTSDHIALRDDVPEKLDIWKKLYQSCKKNEVDYVFHLGNNVYVDTDAYQVNKKTGEKTQTRKEPVPTAFERASKSAGSEQEVINTLRQAYRDAWLHPTARHVLANAPNMIILHELEICDGFGRGVPTGLEHAAYAVYREYCRSLFEDENRKRRPGQAYHFHAFGDVGFVFLDTKVQRALLEGPETGDSSLLGSKQWRDLEYALSSAGYLADCKVLLVCTPSPICQLGERGFMKAGNAKKAVLSDSWNAPAAISEGSALLCKLFDWKAAHPGEREVILLAGSESDGGATEIVDLRYRAAGDVRLERIKQITAGPLASTTRTKKAAKLSGACGLTGYGGYHQFKHTKIFKAPNAAIVDLMRDRREKTLSVTASHIVQKGKLLLVMPSCDSNVRGRGCWRKEPEESVKKVAMLGNFGHDFEADADDQYTTRTPSYNLA